PKRRWSDAPESDRGPLQARCPEGYEADARIRPFRRQHQTENEGSIQFGRRKLPEIAESGSWRAQNRTNCKAGAGTQPMLNRLLTCQNINMTQLAVMLENMAPGYVRAPIKDATG